MKRCFSDSPRLLACKVSNTKEIHANIITYNSAMSSCREAKEWQLAMLLLEDLCTPLYTYTPAPEVSRLFGDLVLGRMRLELL